MDANRHIAKLEAALAERDAALAARARELAERDARIARLEALVEELEGKLKENSRNSGRPPSSDGPGRGKGKSSSRAKKGGGSGRKRGGQKGHAGHHRKMVPAEAVDHFVDLYPPVCSNCDAALPQRADPKAMRHQVTELPEPKPEVTEYRCHAVTCSCGQQTRASLEGVADSSFGPRLSAVVAMLTGVYHLSRRTTQKALKELLGVDASLGAISKVEQRVSEALGAPVDEAWDKVQHAKVKHTDGTTWLEAGVTMQLWTIAAACATVFRILTEATANSLRPLFGQRIGTLVSDRASALYFWAMEARQICWAHLLRRFVSFSQRDGPAGEHGRRLLDYTVLVFDYWQAYKDGAITRTKLIHWMSPLRRDLEAELEKATARELPGLSGSCRDILHHRKALWTFVEEEDVEPTNNEAERELRSFVLWRKKCFGAQSTRGHLFAERVMTVAHTARKQDRPVLRFLTDACRARVVRGPAPSLFASGPASTS